MNKLQKTAWVNLAGTTVAVALAGAGVGLIVHLNGKGIVALMAFLIVGLIAGLVSSLHSIRLQAKFDEREKKIILRAFVLSSYTFIFFCMFASFTVFYLAGAKNSVPAWVLPVLFLVGLFLFKFIQSAAILIQFAREQADDH